MWLAVLGPLSVQPEDSEITVPAAKQRALLAGLLVRANQVTSFDELAAIVWDAAPPATARVSLRNYVKCLRGLLGPAVGARIITRDPGYLISLDDDELDILRFRALCRQGGAAVRAADWKRTAAVLTEALALWRGTPLADIPSETLLRDAVPQLERLRLQAVEWRVDADLNLGRHADLVLELQSLVSEHPLHERFHAQLLLALYRSGRAAEALVAYEHARRLLADQLGADPGPCLRHLHEQILRADKELAAPPAGDRESSAVPISRVASVIPRQLPAAPWHFAGRAAELKALTRLLDDTAGRGRTAVISAVDGTAGVGKSALAIHFAQQVADRFPDGQLYVNLRGFDPAGPPVTPADAIRGFLDALAVEPQRIPASLGAQCALYRSLLAGKRVLIVLDNAPDTEQVRPLLPGSRSCLVVVTSRNQLTGLVAAEGAHPLTLDLLTAEEARELIIRRLGAERVCAEPDAVDEMIGLCARLPLALSVTAAHAASKPEYRLAALAGELRAAGSRLDALDSGDAATDIRAVLSWSYQQLSASARRMFRLLGLHPGPDISAQAAVSLAGIPDAEARRSLRELTRAHLITEDADGRFAFHDLLRAYADEQATSADSGAERRTAIHRMLDHYLHTACAASLRMIPTRHPITLTPAEPGVRPETMTGTAAASAWFEAEHRVLLALISLAAATGFDTHAWQIPWALGRFLDRRGFWHDWAAMERTALTAARRLGDLPGQASAQHSLGYAYARLGQHDKALTHLRQSERIYDQTGDRVGQVNAHIALGLAFEHQGRPADALGHGRQALALARDAGYRTGEALALNAVGWYLARTGSYQQARTYCEQALELHRELDYRSSEAATLDSLGYIHHHLGDFTWALEAYARALVLRREVGDRWGLAETLGHIGDIRHAMGSPHEARTAWQQAATILDELGDQDPQQIRAKLRRADAASGQQIA
jgi:DNA-binding SARP family transcriptional activator/Tfp pilus assembly protein PilF